MWVYKTAQIHCVMYKGIAQETISFIYTACSIFCGYLLKVKLLLVNVKFACSTIEESKGMQQCDS